MRRRTALAVAMALALGGCGLSIPTDPDGTLDRVRSSEVLHVGASPRDGWVEIGDGAPGGREAELVTAYADHLGARVEWIVAGEEQIVALLDEGDLDIAVGGFTEDNAWVDEVGLTRPYTGTHVVMVRMGENALQSDLEQWLDRNGGVP